MQGIEQSQAWNHWVYRCVTDLPQLVSKELHYNIVAVGLEAKQQKGTWMKE